MPKKTTKTEPVTEPVAKPAGEQTVSNEEAARMLASFSAFLRSQSEGPESNELALAADQTAAMARAHIGAKDEKTDETEKESLPSWAKPLANPERLFIHEEAKLELWHAEAEEYGKGEDDVLVHFQRRDDKLVPGGTEADQPIPLEMTDNRFSKSEWKFMVKPILDRYVKSLEIKRLSRTLGQQKTESSERIKSLLPQVFRHEEIKPNQVNLASQAFKTRVAELVNSINTNPEVLKGWIREVVAEGRPEAIQPQKTDKGQNARQPFEALRKQEWLKQLNQRFKKGPSEETLEGYVDQMTEKISKLGEELLMLNTKHTEGVYKPAQVKKDFIETPHMKRILEQLAERALLQLDQKKGMVSLIGDMGTGKNYLVEHLAAKTHRPFFYFPCSRGMDAADLGFHFEFRKGESITVPSQLAKGLKTKNAVILIDEPNALPPEVVSALHGLADHNRTFVYNGVRFQAAEGVVIVMTMNPATYAHVKDLPEAFSDRTLGMDLYLDYPPLTKLDELAQEKLMSPQERQKAQQMDNTLGKKFICDEALILKHQFPSLKDWNDEEFAKLWDVVANGAGAASLGDKATTSKQAQSDTEAILKILRICDAWRKKFKTGDMQRTISLRGSTAVAANYLRTHDVRKAFLDLYKPNSLKYDGGLQDYENLEQVLNDLGELEKELNKQGT